MSTWVTRLIPIILLLVWSLPGYAEIYRCVDSTGNVNFTQHHCGPGQHGKVVNLGGSDASPKPKPAVCKQVEKLAELVFPHIHQTDSILKIYSDLGGREYLSAGITAAVNYVFNFRYNPKARQSNVVALTRDKCLDGGFGHLTTKDLPDWDKIKYTQEKPKHAKQTKEQLAERRKSCQQYNEKLAHLRERLAKAKSKSKKMQTRLDLEYIEGLVRDKCANTTNKE